MSWTSRNTGIAIAAARSAPCRRTAVDMAGIGHQPPHLAADPAEHLDRDLRQRLLEGREILPGKPRQRRLARHIGQRGVDADEVVGLGARLERRRCVSGSGSGSVLARRIFSAIASASSVMLMRE